jgi:hypothetical protein
MVVLPVLAHSLELVLHLANGTPRLLASLAASMAFTALSTLFHLFAMRHGAFIVGADRGSLSSDLRRIPRLVVTFATAGACVVVRASRRANPRGVAARTQRARAEEPRPAADEAASNAES